MPGVAPGSRGADLAADPCPLYEQDLLRQASGLTLRPGGLELTARLLSGCDLPSGSTVLDVGCGCGASLAWLNGDCGYRVVGVDRSARLLGEAAAFHLPVALAPAENLPFPARSFDAVLFECSLSAISMQGACSPGYWIDPGVLYEARRVLRPGGWLLVSDLYARRPEGIPALRDMPGATCLSGLLDLRAVQQALRSLGFEICSWEDHSDALRSLNSRLCQVFGSGQAFWDQALGEAVDAFDLALKIGRAKPGYFILSARKSQEQRAED